MLRLLSEQAIKPSVSQNTITQLLLGPSMAEQRKFFPHFPICLQADLVKKSDKQVSRNHMPGPHANILGQQVL